MKCFDKPSFQAFLTPFGFVITGLMLALGVCLLVVTLFTFKMSCIDDILNAMWNWIESFD